MAGVLAASYHSALVQQIKDAGYRYPVGTVTLHLAREFGFCYGVDRAVDYAYQARQRFPSQQVFLTGEIIHNPHVNEQLREKGIRFLSDPQEQWDGLGANDVVILPAFGVTIDEMQRLDRQGCTLVDTTCGSVLNVWKNVKRYAGDGLTSVIHGNTGTKKHGRPRRRRLPWAASISWCSTRGRRPKSAATFAARFRAAPPCWRGLQRDFSGIRSRTPFGARRVREPDDDAEH